MLFRRPTSAVISIITSNNSNGNNIYFSGRHFHGMVCARRVGIVPIGSDVGCIDDKETIYIHFHALEIEYHLGSTRRYRTITL
jgi:hypothetical protein